MILKSKGSKLSIVNLFADFIHKKINKPDNTVLSTVIQQGLPSLTTGLLLGIVLAICIACPPVGLAIPAAIAMGAIFSAIAFGTCLIAKALGKGIERCGDKEADVPGEAVRAGERSSGKLQENLDICSEVGHFPSLIPVNTQTSQTQRDPSTSSQQGLKDPLILGLKNIV